MKLKTHMSSCTGTPVPSVEWGSNLNASLGHDAMAAHAYKQAVKQVLGYYPESAFPEDGESLDCKSASMARHTCNNIEQRAADILAGWLGEERG